MRIVGIIIIILVLGFFGGYGIMQSQIDDQKEFKGVKNVIPMDNRTEQQIDCLLYTSPSPRDRG